MSECLFCKIVAGEIASVPVAESETALAIRDIAPQAPVHVLVIPKEHVTSADHVTDAHGALVSDLVLLAQRVAEDEGVRESGYRLVMNNGPDAQMSVAHLHLHVLGGRMMGWPPG
ncbi:MAG: histidine triad nucleotide-binding protein [Acidobacteriota bacterium]|nr:histidine triad nucleotide-binding protein [Acidobacteriota bacterium]MDE3093832.1 histidine triad nucleotide-binding protein [Acidobacteriota bacterium]MDE3138584.1 histidine triad nucleotide-binding protein [Acidobacteriota bacterium]MDE3146315.1 histidine triad nucleotide-binding protein [Acidobacteriota bacterium]